MTRGIGEKIGPHPELDPPGYPKDLIFGNYSKEVLARIPRMLLMNFLCLAVFYLIVIPFGPSFLMIYAVVYLIMLPFFMFFFILPLMLLLSYFMFMTQKVFRDHNKVFIEGSGLVIDHTEMLASPYLRNRVPLSNISSVDPTGPDYWKSRKGLGSFWQRTIYPLHLPPDGGLYHSHSDPDNLFVITLRTPQEIDSPYRKVKWFHFIQSEKALVKEIVVDIGREHQGPFLKEISSKGIRVTDRKKSSIPPGSENGYPVFGGGEIDLRNSGLEMRHVKIG